MKLGLKTNQDSISEAAEEWTQKNGPLSSEEKLLFSVMRKSKHNGDGNFTPDEVVRVVKAFGYEQKQFENPKKLIAGAVLAFLLYVIGMIGLVFWATGLSKDYSIGSDGALMNGDHSVTTGLTLRKKGLLDIVTASEQDLMNVEGIVLNQGLTGWAHYKVASSHRATNSSVFFRTQTGQSIKVDADNSVHLDGTLLTLEPSSQPFALLATGSILIP